MNPTNTTKELKLGGKMYTLYFDLNAATRFHKVSGVQLAPWVYKVYQQLTSAREPGSNESSIISSIIETEMDKLQAFLHSAIIEYDRDDEPHWPLSMGKVGRLVDLTALPDILMALIKGNAENMPDSKETASDASARPTENLPKVNHVNGGLPSGPSEEDVLASMTARLDA